MENLEHLDYIYNNGVEKRIEGENMFDTFDEMSLELHNRLNITTLGNVSLGVFVDKEGYKFNIYHIYDQDAVDPKYLLCCTNFV
jgi:hypothetical protein